MRGTTGLEWAALLAAAAIGGCGGDDGTAPREDAGPQDAWIVLSDAAPPTDAQPDAGPVAECPAGHVMGDYHGKPTVFPVGIALEETTDPPVHVTQVLSGSSAEEEGVEVGDEVVRIHGRDVAELSPDRRPWMLVRPTEGETVRVTLRRDGEEERTVTLETRDLLTAPEVGG